MSTITELFDIFKQLRKHELSPGTLEIYTTAIGRLIAAAGDVSAGDLSPLAAMRYTEGLSASGLAATSVNMYLRAAKAFFRWLAVSGQIPRSPFEAVRSLKAPPPGRTMYRAGEVSRMLEACPDDRWRLIVALAVTAGLRRGEILNLTVREIDYAAAVITLAAKPDSPTTWAFELKDRESRQVPITPLSELYLLRMHAELPACQPYLVIRPGRYRRLIAKRNRMGRLPNADAKCPEINFLRAFRAICGRAGVTYRTFHALRGTGLTIMADNGLAPHEVQAIAGHSDVRTTYRHYIHPDEHLARARAAAFGRQVGGEGLEPPTSCL